MSIHYKLGKHDETFDLLEGELPENLLHYFGDQLDRAREILKYRSYDELAYGIESLDWMLRKGSELFLSGLDEAFKTKNIVYSNRVKAIQHFKDNIDLDNQDSFPDAKWSEYFALLTFAYITETIYLNNSEQQSGTSELDKIFEESVKQNIQLKTTEHAIESMDAIANAEGLLAVEDLIKQHNEILQKRGGKGGKMRGSKFNHLKDTCLNIYTDKYTSRSNSDAAKRIVKELTQEDLSVLTTDEPDKTIARWISSHKKALETA